MNKILNLNLKFLPIIQYNKNTFLSIIKNLTHVAYILKTNIFLKMNMITCVSGIDLLSNIKRFAVTYEFYSCSNNIRLKLKVFLSIKEKLTSISHIFSSVN